MADNSSSQSNGDKPFSVDIADYDDDAVAFGTIIHKIGKVKTAIKQMSRSGSSLDAYLVNEFKTSLGTSNWWFDPGTDGEILKIGSKGWKKGKLKFEITVKFYPNEPENEEVNQAEPTLKAFRRTMNN